MGKTAIVTGANSGMGMATVKALSDMGMTVIMLCDLGDLASFKSITGTVL